MAEMSRISVVSPEHKSLLTGQSRGVGSSVALPSGMKWHVPETKSPGSGWQQQCWEQPPTWQRSKANVPGSMWGILTFSLAPPPTPCPWSVCCRAAWHSQGTAASCHTQGHTHPPRPHNTEEAHHEAQIVEEGTKGSPACPAANTTSRPDPREGPGAQALLGLSWKPLFGCF